METKPCKWVQCVKKKSPYTWKRKENLYRQSQRKV